MLAFVGVRFLLIPLELVVHDSFSAPVRDASIILPGRHFGYPQKSPTPLDFAKVRERLDAFEFGRLFIEELVWSNPPAARPSTIAIDGAQWTIRTIAQLSGVGVIEVQNSDGTIPDAAAKRKLHRDISMLHHENLLIFVDTARTRSEWYWVKREYEERGATHLAADRQRTLRQQSAQNQSVRVDSATASPSRVEIWPSSPRRIGPLPLMRSFLSAEA